MWHWGKVKKKNQRWGFGGSVGYCWDRGFTAVILVRDSSAKNLIFRALSLPLRRKQSTRNKNKRLVVHNIAAHCVISRVWYRRDPHDPPHPAVPLPPRHCHTPATATHTPLIFTQFRSFFTHFPSFFNPFSPIFAHSSLIFTAISTHFFRRFTYYEPPTVTAVSPASGRTGTLVTVSVAGNRSVLMRKWRKTANFDIQMVDFDSKMVEFDMK
jgi:hypothetical protein